MSLYDKVRAERFGPPVRTDRPRPPASSHDVQALLNESVRLPLYLGRECSYAACDRPATAKADGWDLCGGHFNLHVRDVA